MYNDDMPKTNSSVVTPTNVVIEKHVWSKEEGETLLDLYDENKEKFKNPAVRKIGIWADIAKTINSKFGSDFTAEQCHQKLRNFKNDFQKVMMLEKKDCRHFERLHRIFLQSALRPSQSPAALKRKLTQLAGTKPEDLKADSGNQNTNPKRRRVSFPDFRSRPILPKPQGNHSQNTRPPVKSKPTYQNLVNTNQMVSKKHATNTTYPISIVQSTSSTSSVNSNSNNYIPWPPTANTYASNVHLATTCQNNNLKSMVPDVSPTVFESNRKRHSPVIINMLDDTPTMVEYKSRSSLGTNDGTSVGTATSKVVQSDKKTGKSGTETNEELTTTNDLPVPLYYYSRKEIEPLQHDVISGAGTVEYPNYGTAVNEDRMRGVAIASQISQSQMNHATSNEKSMNQAYVREIHLNETRVHEPEKSKTSWIQENELIKHENDGERISVSSSSETSSKTAGNSSLSLLRGLFDSKKGKTHQTPSDEANDVGKVTENNTHGDSDKTVIDLTDSQKIDNASLVAESLDKWRQQNAEFERARIKREMEREQRQEERHQENLKMTSNFIKLFEMMVSKINGSSE
eukprot:Seg56.2 transcript_id=Seg56.2/GoldUCD/mRNA.D3Y31 product="hypothetical protein" protein_id=Seg56.2/GoldUCD/D3Y31